ncbi:energy-coupling factor ABC transporter ATP-binding protein [Paenibacillus sp. CAU 1782]
MTQQLIVELEDVSVTVKSRDRSEEVRLLHAINLRIRQGEWISVIGMNGSGKSTLSRLVAGIHHFEVTGDIRYGGEKQQSDILQGAAPIVMQHPDAGLIGSTPWEDVVLMLERHGCPEAEIINKAEEVLAKVGLGGRLHQKMDTLSGGQKQLTAIAGCLAVAPSMLLLDEPTAMLDSEASAYVLSQVRRLHESGVTVIWVTQLLDELNSADRVLLLEAGRIVFDEAAHQLFGRDESGQSPGERHGFMPPYAVQVARELVQHGMALEPVPLNRRELEEAVMRYDR